MQALRAQCNEVLPKNTEGTNLNDFNEQDIWMFRV